MDELDDIFVEDILEKEEALTTSFYGDALNILPMITYFLKKYPYACSPIDVRYMNGYIQWLCEFDQNDNCIRYLSIPPTYVEHFYKCLQNDDIRFIFDIIMLKQKNSKINDYGTHLIAWLYDRNDNTVEIFEPQGQREEFIDDPWFEEAYFYEEISKLFKQKFGVKDVITSFCPKISFQAIQKKDNESLSTDPFGFCGAWSLWWIDYRLANYKSAKTRQELVSTALNKIKKSNYSFTKFIRNYSQFVANIKQQAILMVYDELNQTEKGRQIIQDIAENDMALNTLSKLSSKQKEVEILNIADKYKHIDYNMIFKNIINQLEKQRKNIFISE